MAVALCLLPGEHAARAQAEKPSEDPIQQLLDGDGPPPDWRDHLRKYPKPQMEPGAAASDDDLIEFWEWAPRDTVPDTQTTNRLVEVCEHQPREFTALARFLPTDNREAAERLKSLHDKLAAKHNEEGNALAEYVRKWLMLNSEFFRDELVTAAAEGSAEAIERLIKVDSALAQRCFQEHVTDKDSDARASALSALISHSFPDLNASTRADYLEKLKQIMVESGASVQAKRTALEAVMANNSPENEKWFLDLFRHRALSQEEEYSSGFAPLATIVAKEPDYWIPKIIPLLKSRDNAVRATAAECLVGFQLEHARRDALMPLLPWIADPKWTTTSDANGRLRLLQCLGRVELPESVPYLRKAVRSDRAYELEATAEALARYQVRDTAPSLKEAGIREGDPHHRRAVVRALLKLDGFRPEEIAQGLRDYALKVAALPDEEWTGQAWEEISKSPRPLILDLGHEASYAEIRNDAAAKAVAKEIQQLEGTNQRAAEILWKALARWPTSSAYAASIQRLRDGHIAAPWLLALLDAKTQLPDALKEVRDLRGTPRGVQAALSRDRSLIDDVLKNDDADAQRALVACARVARIDLPLGPLTHMLSSRNEQLATAADRYLETMDTAETRAALKKRAANRRREFGTQLNFSAFPMENGEISRTEKQLREFFDHEDPPREIYALLSEGNFGSDGQRALLVYDGRTILRCADGNGRFRERDVPPIEFSALRDWIEKNKVADLPPYDEGTMDGIQLQYVHLTPDAGERVFMNNPPGGPMGAASFSPGITEPRPDPIVYAELTRRMMKLNQVPMPVLYPALKGLEGFRLVQVKEDGKVTALRVRNGQMFAGVSVSYDNRPSGIGSPTPAWRKSSLPK